MWWGWRVERVASGSEGYIHRTGAERRGFVCGREFDTVCRIDLYSLQNHRDAGPISDVQSRADDGGGRMNTWMWKSAAAVGVILGVGLQAACTGEQPGEKPWQLRADGADTSRVDASQTGTRGRDAGSTSVDALDASRPDPENIPSGPRIRTPDGWSEPVAVEGECEPRPKPSKACYDFRYPKGPLALRVAKHKGSRDRRESKKRAR